MTSEPDRDTIADDCLAAHCPPRADGICDWPRCSGQSDDLVLVGQRVGDVGAAPGDGDDEPLSAELPDGFPRGAAGYAEFLLDLLL